MVDTDVTRRYGCMLRGDCEGEILYHWCGMVQPGSMRRMQLSHGANHAEAIRIHRTIGLDKREVHLTKDAEIGMQGAPGLYGYRPHR